MMTVIYFLTRLSSLTIKPATDFRDRNWQNIIPTMAHGMVGPYFGERFPFFTLFSFLFKIWFEYVGSKKGCLFSVRFYHA